MVVLTADYTYVSVSQKVTVEAIDYKCADRKKVGELRGDIGATS
jgi:hypothetical protein